MQVPLPVFYSAFSFPQVMLTIPSRFRMWATDVAPSRLEHAKYLLRELVDRTGNDRFGIVAFAGRAFLACPLTSDKTTLNQYIDELSPASVPIGGTNLEMPIQIALQAFDAAAGNRAVLLMTDGDELSGDSAGAVAKLRERKIPLFVVGLGDPNIAAPVPDEGGGFKRTAKGELATSRLNESKLREFAAETGGIYVRSTVTDPGLTPIINRIDSLGKAEQESRDKSIPYDDFPFLLGAAALLFVLYLVTGERPFEWRKAAGLLALALPLLCIGATPAELYNSAREGQLAGDKKASELYEQAIREGVGDREVRARALYNLGIAAHQGVEADIKKALDSVKSQQLDPALKTLDEALGRIGETEELYSQSLASSGTPPNNLGRLAADRNQIEVLKKKIEELKKQQQKAQQQAQQARNQNKQQQQQQQNQQQQNQQQQNQQQQNQQQQQQQQQQQNQQQQNQQQQNQQQQNQQQQNQQQQNQQQQNQQQQNQQQQNQQQQNQQQQNQQQQNQQAQKDRQKQQGKSADEAIEKAKQEAEKLQQQADALDQKKMSEQAQKARQELEKAAEERKNDRQDQAQKHLDEAVKALSSGGGQNQENQKNQQGKDQKDQKDQQGKDQKDQKDQQGKDQKDRKEQQSAAEQSASTGNKEEKKQDISPDTAEQMLRMMEEEEKSLRDRINQGRSVRERKVEKDW